MGRKAYIKQAAVELGLTEYQLRRIAKEGKLPFLRSGVKFIFDIELCEEALKKTGPGKYENRRTCQTIWCIKKSRR